MPTHRTRRHVRLDRFGQWTADDRFRALIDLSVYERADPEHVVRQRPLVDQANFAAQSRQLYQRLFELFGREAEINRGLSLRM